MVEADTYCLMGLLFAAFVSLTSMSGFWWFEVQPGYEWLADTIVIFWVGLSMSIVAWMKVWMGMSFLCDSRVPYADTGTQRNQRLTQVTTCVVRRRRTC
jgi:hypothetical protein